MQFNQGDFRGGQNLLLCSCALAENEYVFGVNVRTRTSNVKPINNPLLIDAPVGNYQGLYAIGNLLLLFVSGKAYYKSYAETIWIKVENFQLSTTASRVWGCMVPQTNDQFKRQASSTQGEITTISAILDKTTLQIPAAFVCQDGINQPWVIFIDGSARQCNSYTEWTTLNREYVPIGRQMVFMSGILFTVSADGRSIYRSVSGRPLDYMVNVTSTGTAGGDATTISFAVDYNEITCISATNAGTLFVATAYNSYNIQLDYTQTIFGEPTFITPQISASGVINQYCFVETLGDYAFVDYEGIKSFNAVQQLKFRGNNSVFSLPLSNIFAEVEQNDNVAAVRFDNYLLFALNSTFGYVVAVYDELLQKHVSLDITPCIQIKQFATLYTIGNKAIFAITADNKLFQLFAAADHAEALIKTKTWTAKVDKSIYNSIEGQDITLHKSNYLRIVFEGGTLTTLNCLEEVDDRRSSTQVTREFEVTEVGMTFPVEFPIMQQTRTINDVLVRFPKAKDGYKIGYTLRWTGGAEIQALELSTTVNTSVVSNKAKS